MRFKNEETNIQVAVSNYLKYKYPNVLYTIAPNGIKLSIHVAKMLKAMGYRKGTPDLMVFEPRGKAHGLFLELKTDEGVVSEAQSLFIESAKVRGYCAYVVFGYEKAIKVIEEYLNDK